jgi:nucleotide-binding universal stress UspA family protein
VEYKTIAVHIDDGKRCAARLGVASQLAQQFDAHLVGVYAVDPPGLDAFAAAEPSGTVGGLREEYMGKKLAIAESRLQEATRVHAVDRAEFRHEPGSAVDAVVRQARYADLLVIGQNDPDEAASGVSRSFPENVVLSCGRPTLIVPYYADSFPKVGTQVLVAWKATREATRAVTDALPILQKARKVWVMSVDLKPDRDGHKEIPQADISVYLARHGVTVEAIGSYAAEVAVGDELLARAFDMDVDLLVMGAYGHSRIRESILGGVTQTLIKHMTVPVLMSH